MSHIRDLPSLRSTARRRRALESEQGPSVGFQVLAIVGLLVSATAFVSCLLSVIATVIAWVQQGLGAGQ